MSEEVPKHEDKKPRKSNQEKAEINEDRLRYIHPEDIKFLRFLAEKAHCSAHTIHELTGINPQTILWICHSADITMPNARKGGAQNVHTIRVARTMGIIRAKYGEALERIRKNFHSSEG